MDSSNQPSTLISKIRESGSGALEYLRTPGGKRDMFKVYNKTSALAAACEVGDIDLIEALNVEACMRNVEPPAIFRYLGYLGGARVECDKGHRLPELLLTAEANLRQNGELPLSKLLSDQNVKKYIDHIKFLSRVTIIDNQREALKLFSDVDLLLGLDDKQEVLKNILNFSATVPTCYGWMETFCAICSPHPVIVEYIQKVMALYEPRNKSLDTAEKDLKSKDKTTTKPTSDETLPDDLTPLHMAVLRNNVYEVFNNVGTYKTRRDKNGNTALMYAARAGYKHCIRHLLMECKIPNEKGELPTMWLALKGNDECLRGGLLEPELLEATDNAGGSAVLWSLYNLQPTKARFNSLSPDIPNNAAENLINKAKRVAIFRALEKVTAK